MARECIDGIICERFQCAEFPECKIAVVQIVANHIRSLQRGSSSHKAVMASKKHIGEEARNLGVDPTVLSHAVAAGLESLGKQIGPTDLT